MEDKKFYKKNIQEIFASINHCWPGELLMLWRTIVYAINHGIY